MCLAISIRHTININGDLLQIHEWTLSVKKDALFSSRSPGKTFLQTAGKRLWQYPKQQNTSQFKNRNSETISLKLPSPSCPDRAILKDQVKN